MSQPKPVPAPGQPELAHAFSDAQQQSVQQIFDEIAQIQQRLVFFLDYVRREAKLPNKANGYTLSEDRLGLVEAPQRSMQLG